MKKFKVLCKKTVKGSFLEGNEYECEEINIVLTSAPQLIANDESGFKGHIIAEGIPLEDEWFNEHFVFVE